MQTYNKQTLINKVVESINNIKQKLQQHHDITIIKRSESISFKPFRKCIDKTELNAVCYRQGLKVVVNQTKECVVYE